VPTQIPAVPLCLGNSSRTSVKAQLCDPVIPLAMESMTSARDNVCRCKSEKEW